MICREKLLAWLEKVQQANQGQAWSYEAGKGHAYGIVMREIERGTFNIEPEGRCDT